MTMMENLENLLHEHYKDTFAHIRERERQRDRLFLIIVALLGILVLQLRYSLFLSQAVSEVGFAGVKLKLSEVPMPVLLSTTWTFLSVMLLRYCQVAVHVDKQYDYLHCLEGRLSEAMGDKRAVYRESSGYFTKKTQCFRNWSWVFYTAFFPAIIVVSVCWSTFLEWHAKAIPMPHKFYDSALGVLTIISLVLYTVGLWLKR